MQINRVCAKCGVTVDTSGMTLHEIRRTVPACPEHRAEVEAEVKKVGSMWPSDWRGGVWRDRYGNWINHERGDKR